MPYSTVQARLRGATLLPYFPHGRARRSCALPWAILKAAYSGQSTDAFELLNPSDLYR